MPQAAMLILLLSATFAIAWVGGMDYQRTRLLQRERKERS
jgi:hypothetical protein